MDSIVLISHGQDQQDKLVRFAHNWNDGIVEYWNIGSFLYRVEKHCDSRDKPIMDRKNISWINFRLTCKLPLGIFPTEKDSFLSVG